MPPTCKSRLHPLAIALTTLLLPQAAFAAVAPTFVGGVPVLTAASNPTATEFREQLSVSDTDLGENLTWTVLTAPSHGTLSGFPATAVTNCENNVCDATAGSLVTKPSATVSYTPTAGYTGTDTFTIQVSDGTSTATQTFTVKAAATAGGSATPADSTALVTALQDPSISTINLVSGTTYQIQGSDLNRALTINGNNAVIEVLGGMGRDLDHQTIFHLGMVNADGSRRYRGNLFWRITTGADVTLNNLTLRNAATTANAQGLTGVFTPLFLTGSGNLTLNRITFENFWFTNGNYLAQNDLTTAQGIGNYPTYSDLSFGVYANNDYTGNLRISNSTFGSSNAFREAIHIFNCGTAEIDSSTFTGTAHQSRLRASDGYEYGIYVYGGNITVRNSTFTGYRAHVNNNSYVSTALAGIGYVAGSQLNLYDNTVSNSSNSLTMNGSWNSFQPGGELSINGYSLKTQAGLAIFAAVNANELGAGAEGNLRASAGDDYMDPYYATTDEVLKFTSRTPTTATFALNTGLSLPINTTSYVVEQSSDGQTWSAATTTPAGPLTSSTTAFTVTGLNANTRYYFRARDTDSSSNYYGSSNLVALPVLSNQATTDTTVTLGFDTLGSRNVRVQQSSDGGTTWTTATLESAMTRTSSSAKVTGLQALTDYKFRLDGTGNTGWGWSNEVSARTSATPTPPANPYNPAGNSTSGNVTTNIGTDLGGGVSVTPASGSIISNLSEVNQTTGVSDNGVVVVIAPPGKTIKLVDNAPDGVLFSLPVQQTVPVQLQGKTIEIVVNNEVVKDIHGKPLTAVLATRTVTDAQGNRQQVLEVISGQGQFKASAANQTIGSLTLSQGGTLRTVTIVDNAGNGGGTAVPGTAGFFKDPGDKSGSVSAENGAIVLRVVLTPDSGKNTLAADLEETRLITLQAGEVARFNAKGELIGVFAGSLSGTVGKTGDPLSALVPPAGLDKYPSRVLKLDGNTLDRLGSNLLPGFASVISNTGNFAADEVATSATLSQEATTGIVTATSPLRPDLSYFGLPVGDVTINPEVADGIVWHTNGTVTWTLKGVSVTFAPVSGSLGELAASAKQMGYTTQVLDNGAFKLSGAGTYLVGQPRFHAQRLGQPAGLAWDHQQQRAYFADSHGHTQYIDPVPYDGSQLDAAVASLPGWKLERDYFLYGGVRLSGPDARKMVLVPEYSVTLERSEPGTSYSGSDGRFLFHYKTGFLPFTQSFLIK